MGTELILSEPFDLGITLFADIFFIFIYIHRFWGKIVSFIMRIKSYFLYNLTSYDVNPTIPGI